MDKRGRRGHEESFQRLSGWMYNPQQRGRGKSEDFIYGAITAWHAIPSNCVQGSQYAGNKEKTE